MKEDWIDSISLKIRPELNERSGLPRSGALLDMSVTVSTAPFAFAGLIWLILVSDIAVFQSNWPLFLLFTLLLFLFSRTSFELELPLTKAASATASGDLGPYIQFAGILLLGPTIVWTFLVVILLNNAWEFRREIDIDLRWAKVSASFQQTAVFTLINLIAITVYQWLGGTIPISGLSWPAIWPALITYLIILLFQTIFLIPYGFRISKVMRAYQQEIQQTTWQFLLFLFISINISNLATPFGILAAGIYSEHGVGIFLFLMLGFYAASLLAYRLSNAIAKSQQRSRELAVLEELSHAILDSSVEHDALPALLNQHMPGMFSRAAVAIWRDNEVIYSNLEHMPGLDKAMAWVANGGENPPFEVNKLRRHNENFGKVYRKGLAIPIKSEEQTILGGVYVAKREDFGDVYDLLPALQSLAGQIASAIQRLLAYQQTVANVRMSRELEIAGQIQNSFLPESVPSMQGWELTANLVPARQTSGDFYDFVELDNGRLAIIIADVADKGTGAALYMALSRTLIRTYAMAHPDHPEIALQLANERILIDTKSDQFVTVFLGILDTQNKTMIYANAGHNPAYLFSQNTAVQSLGNTGIPLGMFEGMQWKRNSVDFASGDVLVMYTDGVTEAQNSLEDEFGEQRLIDIVTNGMENGRSAVQIEKEILSAIEDFVGNAPQFDDITLLMTSRLKTP